MKKLLFTLEDLKTMPYEEFLETFYWKKLRKKILIRDKYRCQKCYRFVGTRLLRVHHKTYERRGCELMADLITLCDACHKKEHMIKPLN